MNMSTIYQQCLYISIVMIVFTLAVNMIGVLWIDLGAVPGTEHYGSEVDDSEGYSSVLQNFSGTSMSLNDIWTIGVLSIGSLTGFLAGVASIVSKQWQPFGVYIFGLIFWGSFTHCLVYFSSWNIDPLITTCFTVPVMFLFVGGAAAIFGGQG